MATRKIKDAKDLATNELIYFKGHAKATYMSDGRTVEDAINNIPIGGEGDYITDFTIDDLLLVASGPSNDIQFDITSLLNALRNNKRIIVPHMEGIDGYGLFVGFADDFLYGVVITDQNSICIEASNYQIGSIRKGEVKVTSFERMQEKLDELSERVDNLPQGASMTPITYAELVKLRDSGSLVAGSFYRITDYITTTAQENTQSAEHPFDVIVLALSENTLAEEAYAIQSARDTDGYFANSNLAAWKLWYSLDNDTERFAWADAENGKGVIYRMIDEWDNDVPYDFKNIMFVRYKLEAPEEYIADRNDSLWMQQLCNNLRSMFDEGVRSFVWAGIADEDKYWEDDMSQILSHTTGDSFAFFTFNTDEDTDASLSGGINDNKMQFSQTLPNNVFFGNGCYSNTFGNGCYYNSFGNDCNSNSFGNDCNYNSFGNDCYYNTFGNSCYYNTFGNSYYSNTFGNDCNSNSFGNDCCYNTFGNGCYSNTFGNGCYYNSFGNDCYYNTFGNSYYSNTFGNDCNSNSFKDQDGIADNASYNKLDDGVNNIELWYDDNNGNYGELKNHHVCRGCKERLIEIYENRDFETTYAMTSDGELKEFCLADLIA